VSWNDLLAFQMVSVNTAFLKKGFGYDMAWKLVICPFPYFRFWWSLISHWWWCLVPDDLSPTFVNVTGFSCDIFCNVLI